VGVVGGSVVSDVVFVGCCCLLFVVGLYKLYYSTVYTVGLAGIVFSTDVQIYLIYSHH